MFKFLAGLKRIVSVTEDLMYLLGRSLQRRAMRNGLLVAFAYGSTLIGVKVAGSQDLSKEQVLGLLAAAFASYPAGVLLVRISDLLVRSNLLAAAGGHLHLTSHYKKSQMRTHLLVMWNRVYRHEAAMRKNIDDVINARARLKAADETIRYWIENLPVRMRKAMQLRSALDEDALVDRILSGYAHDPDVEATRELFVLSGIYALRSPMPQVVQERQVGFDISIMEDWYEKGLFTYEDFPGKAFARDPLIRRLQDHVTNPWLNRLLRWISPEAAPSFWFAFTVRKLGVLIGKAIAEINRVPTASSANGYFNAQHFLWPSADVDEEVLTHFGDRGAEFLEHLIRLRRRVMHSLFSSDLATAKQHVLRMFVADYRRILKLRLRYDVEYAAGLLPDKPEDELRELEASYGRPGITKRRLQSLMGSARDSIRAFDALFAAGGEQPGSEEWRRAARIAYHINFQKIRGSGDLLQQCRGIDVGQITASVIRIRIFHALVVVQLHTYTDVVERFSHPVHNPDPG